jgi:hypothetical protein
LCTGLKPSLSPTMQMTLLCTLADRDMGVVIERVRMPAVDGPGSLSLPEWLERMVLLAMRGRCPFGSRVSLGEEEEDCLGRSGGGWASVEAKALFSIPGEGDNWYPLVCSCSLRSLFLPLPQEASHAPMLFSWASSWEVTPCLSRHSTCTP